MRTRAQHFDDTCYEAYNLFKVRNKQYGDAIKETGVLGATVELIAVTARLKQLVVKAPNHFPDHNAPKQREQIRNALIDAHNYANIGLMMFDEENWNGE